MKRTMNASIPNTTRREVYRRDGWRCALCDSTDGIQIHHVKPRGKGGSDHPMNLITLCWRCHAAAHGSIMQADPWIRAEYKGRQDGDVLTWDIRMKKPNHGDYLSARPLRK